MKKIFVCILTLVLTASAVISSVSAAPRDEALPGEAYNVVYYEEFNYDNTTGNDAVAALLQWTELSKTAKNAVTDPTASYSIKDGRLYVQNNKSNGQDSYIKIFDDTKMLGLWMGDYTVQFDVTLTSAGDNSRYIAILTDYKDGTKGDYHSFHLRINGTANNQARINGKWSTFDAEGNYFAADKDDSDGTSTIAKKILGKNYDGSQILKNVDLTIRIVCEKLDIGPRVYIRNNSDGGDFVLVSRAGSDEAPTSTSWRQTGGKSIVLKAGGKIDGYVDNIVIYKGTGEPCWEEIKVPETTEVPETTAEPETEPISEPETESATEPITEFVTETVSEDKGCAASVGVPSILAIILVAGVLRKKWTDPSGQ